MEFVRKLLRLLHDGATVEEYQVLLDRCPRDELPRLRPLVDDALELRAQLEERRRREAELAALYETAGDLSALRDLEAVLRAIVRRARGLLGTDVAYLMLNDTELGDTYMRVTDGIRSPGFKRTRLAMGAGLGGLVAKTAVPYNTADYLADTRFEHTVDGVVRSEGLIAIQGVPLKLGERVIGVLFAANRTARPFSDHEVTLLISLANHAAIAIENATLFHDVRRAVDELTEANTVIQAHSASLEQAAALHERLTTIVLRGGGGAEHRLRGEILEDLLGAPHRDLEGLRRRAALVGLDLGRPHIVLAARCRSGGHRRGIADAATSYAAQSAGLAGEYRGNVIVLLPDDQPPAEIAPALARLLSQAVRDAVTVGAAAAAAGIDALVEAHQDASRCLDVLLALDRDGQGASPDELGVYGLLLSQAGREELHHFVRRTIGPVLDYDERRCGELVRTLLAYFGCDGNLTRTAAELYIHVNTLYQRIDRITALLGPQWRHADQALQVHLALKIHTAIPGTG